MKRTIILFIIICLLFPYSFCENLAESSIVKNDYTLGDFFSKYVNDPDIEVFIKEEINKDSTIVSLDECLDIALYNNFQIKIAETEYKSSKYEYRYALSAFAPILSNSNYLADYSGQILVGGVLNDKFHETAISINLTATHLLFEGGKQIFEARAKKFLYNSKGYNSKYTVSEVIYYVATYYYELLAAKLSIQIFLKNLIETKNELALAKVIKTSDFDTKFDIARSNNEYMQAKIDLLKAMNDFRLSQTKLAKILGIELNVKLMPFESDVKKLDLVDSKIPIDNLFQEAIENRQDLKSYNYLIGNEKEIKKKYITDFFPKPSISVQQQFQGTVNTGVRPNYILTAFLNWIPGENTVFGTYSKIKLQNEKIKLKQLEYDCKLRDIEENIINSTNNSLFSERQINFTEQKLEYSFSSISYAILKFNSKKGNLLDIIQAQNEMTYSRVENINSIIKYNTSQIQLAFEIGLISKELMCEKYKP